jgi:putative PEP-CTERM system TPR-repeat lipoprotein
MVQARLHAEEFYARFRNYLPARKLLAMVNLSESKYAQVEQLLRPVVEAKEDDVVALNLLTNALMGLGKTDEAIELLSKVAALQPDSPMAQVRLGAGLLMSGEQGGGIEHLESAVRLDPSNQKADVLLVLNHLQQKQFEQALQAAEAYRQRNPDSTAPHNLLGRVYFLMGEIDNAKKSLNNALKMEPADPVANQALATLALENGDKKAARAYYQNVLKKRENHLSTLILLAVLDAKEDKEADMVKHLEQAIDAYPRAIQPRLLLAKHYLQKKEPERVPLLFVDVEDSQRNLPPVLDAIALSQLMKKEFSLAKSTLKKRAELPPESAQTHNLLARAYIGLNDFEQAKKELHRAIEIDPKHFEARLALTKILVLEKNPDAVKENVQVLKEIAPDVVDVVALEVSLAQMEGDKEKAYTLAKNFHEKSPSTNSMLMVASQKRRAGDVNGSIEFQEQWLKEHPDDLMAHLALANVHIMDSRIDAAIEQNKKILQLDKNNLIALNNLAWHLKDSQPKQALEYAQRVNELAPENAAMMDTLAVVMLKNGQAKKAQRIMDKVLKLQPKDPTLRYHSAMIDAAAGDISSAEVKLTSLIEDGEKFPEKEEAKQLLSELQSAQ